MKPKYLIVLDALETGLEVDLFGTKVIMQDHQMGVWLDWYGDRGQYLGVRFGGIDINFNLFVIECDRLTDTYVAGLAADIALNRMRRR